MSGRTASGGRSNAAAYTPNWGLQIAVFNYFSALREDLKVSAFVTRFLG